MREHLPSALNTRQASTNNFALRASMRFRVERADQPDFVNGFITVRDAVGNGVGHVVFPDNGGDRSCTTGFDIGECGLSLNALANRLRPHVFRDAIDLPEVAERVFHRKLGLPGVAASALGLGVGADARRFSRSRNL